MRHIISTAGSLRNVNEVLSVIPLHLWKFEVPEYRKPAPLSIEFRSVDIIVVTGELGITMILRTVHPHFSLSKVTSLLADLLHWFRPVVRTVSHEGS